MAPFMYVMINNGLKGPETPKDFMKEYEEIDVQKLFILFAIFNLINLNISQSSGS